MTCYAKWMPVEKITTYYNKEAAEYEQALRDASQETVFCLDPEAPYHMLSLNKKFELSPIKNAKQKYKDKTIKVKQQCLYNPALVKSKVRHNMQSMHMEYLSSMNEKFKNELEQAV